MNDLRTQVMEQVYEMKYSGLIPTLRPLPAEMSARNYISKLKTLRRIAKQFRDQYISGNASKEMVSKSIVVTEFMQFLSKKISEGYDLKVTDCIKMMSDPETKRIIQPKRSCGFSESEIAELYEEETRGFYTTATPSYHDYTPVVKGHNKKLVDGKLVRRKNAASHWTTVERPSDYGVGVNEIIS
jgi:hypothetical protein